MAPFHRPPASSERDLDKLHVAWNLGVGRYQGRDAESPANLRQIGLVVAPQERGDRLPIELAPLLHESWLVKKRLSAKISADEIDALAAEIGQALGSLV